MTLGKQIHLDSQITDAYRTNPQLANLMHDPFFKDVLSQTQQNWREVVSLATLNGIPCPAFSASLGYYDSYRAERLPANHRKFEELSHDSPTSGEGPRYSQPVGKFVTSDHS